MREEVFPAADAGWLEALYRKWLDAPGSVPERWARVFAGWEAPAAPGRAPEAAPAGMRGVEHPSRAIYLIHGYRVHGHRAADLDPLRLDPQPRPPELELAYYGLSEQDLDTPFPTGDLAGPPVRPLREIVAQLEETYCGHLGPEFMHITDSARKHWLQERLERTRSRPGYDADTRRRIFGRILHATEFELFLHTRYTGQKRFSVEGAESLIPMIDRFIQQAGEAGAKEIVIGMAHRGRLNVLANIVEKPLAEIFAEFEGELEEIAHGTGDVKYHLGFSNDVTTPAGRVHVSLAFNPSHLEIIGPVVLGSVRARQRRRGDHARREVIPLLIHGDAAFAGQGVVAETFNLSKLRGFRVGGCVHLVVNNQIGFTVNPFDARSSMYATDIAKMVQAPILHVNGDDPEACCFAMELALAYRNRFHEDVVVDLVCYRRRGHNEADTPEVTQPVMYRRIRTHPPVLEIYRKQLMDEGVLSENDAEAMRTAYRKFLREMQAHRDWAAAPARDALDGRWAGFHRLPTKEPKTAVPKKRLVELCRKAHALPEGFRLHPLVAKIFAARQKMAEGKQPADWGFAEIMAYATLVADGGWVRITGQDTGRGTFFHRHAIVYDQETGEAFTPLRQVESGELSHFVCYDSLLSELAVCAFEYGYSVAEPRALVIWEAQYGDFANNAQVVIDQFVASGETKWGRMSGLVLWLPHGLEGQGPEHSSARPERFLQLCAEKNMQVVYPTTPAQLFHLLRRQYLMDARKPLVLLGPKGMLHRRATFSALSAFTRGRFLPVLDDEAADPTRAKRLLLCTGKVFYDLDEARREKGMHEVAIVRIERLYPFPYDELTAITARFAAAGEVVWVQEEPVNQGFWYWIEHCLARCLHAGQRLAHVARAPAAAPACGSARRFAWEQKQLVAAALDLAPIGKRRLVGVMEEGDDEAA